MGKERRGKGRWFQSIGDPDPRLRVLSGGKIHSPSLASSTVAQASNDADGTAGLIIYKEKKEENIEEEFNFLVPSKECK